MSEKVPYSNYRLTIRIEINNRSGMFSKVVSLIAKERAIVAAVDLVEVTKRRVVRDVTVDVGDVRHGYHLTERLKKVKGVRILSVSDQIFLLHLGGKITVQSKFPITTRNRLSMLYTPGVARVSSAIAEHPSAVHSLTVKSNSVAIVSDGSAVLGLGNLGAEASIPVMEGKAMIFREFAGINAWPICVKSQDTDEIVRTVQNIAPVFGAINLEDISAPRCFEIEERLKKVLDIPVMHDDQHGTAIAVLAALTNALKIVKKDLAKCHIVINGLGAAGIACFRILLAAGAKHIVGCDKAGVVLTGERNVLWKNRRNLYALVDAKKPKTPLLDALKSADVFIGLSAGNILKATALKKMKKNNVVFAMANPDPEVDPHEAIKYCRVFATGRSDFPNQINNALAFPGVFRGALDVRAKSISEGMKLAAAKALAALVDRDKLGTEYIIPSIFDKRVAAQVSYAVAEAAVNEGLARRRSKEQKPLEDIARD